MNYARGVNYPGQEVVALSNLIAPLGETWRSLRPERMDHVETGITVTPRPATTIDAAIFDDRLTSRYVFGFPPVVARPAFVNLGGYRVRGAELSLRQSFASTWQAFGGLTLLDSSLDTLPYAPARALVVGVTSAHGPFSLSIDAQAQSSMFVLAASRTAGAANTQRVAGFAVVNVRPAWRLPWLEGRATVFAAIENLFDTAYAYRPGYPMPGTSLQVGISIR
jgi:iron complex outermembrane receptor protein